MFQCRRIKILPGIDQFLGGNNLKKLTENLILNKFLCCPRSCALLQAFAAAPFCNDGKSSFQLWVGGVFSPTPWPLTASAVSACLCQRVAVLLTPSPWGSPTTPHGVGKRASGATVGAAEGVRNFHGCPCLQGWL